MHTVETWVEAHRDRIVLAMIGIGLAPRVRNAAFACLHADEALHFLLTLQPKLREVWRIGSYNAHPPSRGGGNEGG